LANARKYRENSRMRPAPFVFLLLVPLACSAQKGSVEAVQLADVQSFCSAWARVACNDQVVSRCAAESKEACISAQQSFCETLVPDGRYSGATAPACLDAVQTAYADAVLTAEERDTVRKLSAPCDKIVSGSTGTDGACTEDGDCNRDVDLSCVKKAGARTGKCEKPSSVAGGISCAAPDIVCDDGFYCDGSHCVEEVGEGAQCSPSEPCKADYQCLTERGTPVAGAEDGAVESGTCRARKKIGEACRTEDDCLSRICAPRMNPASGVCAEQILLTPSEPICMDL
jgi:hypothetical protein